MIWQAEIWYDYDEEAVRGEGHKIVGQLYVLLREIADMSAIRLIELTPVNR